MAEESIVSLVGKRVDDKANADAIECLETWLEMARNGEITSVAIAGIGPGKAITGHSIWIDERLVGATAMLHHRITAKMAE